MSITLRGIKPSVKNTLNDELQALEKELVAKRSAFEAEAQNRTAELDAREKAIASRENDMESLQKEVDSFPKRNDAAVQKAVADTTESLTRNFKSDQALMEARFEGERKRSYGEKSRRLRRRWRHRRHKSAIWPKRMNWPTKKFRTSPTGPSPLPGETCIQLRSNNPAFRCVTTARGGQ
jgi:hypothetical protein